MREIDDAASRRHNLPALTLMENAGRAVAEQARRFLGKKDAKVVVCCGRGANGGDGLVAARYLAEGGARVKVFLCPPKKIGPAGGGDYPELVRVNLQNARDAGVAVVEAGPEAGLTQALSECDAAVDALLGTGSSGKPAGAIHHMIQELNRSRKPVLAVDVPSGIHPDTGYHSGVFVIAAETYALGLPKRGLVTPYAAKCVGVLKVLPIGYPAELLRA